MNLADNIVGLCSDLIIHKLITYKLLIVTKYAPLLGMLKQKLQGVSYE